MVTKKKKTYIYESPDKGQTVFRHELGKLETKELVEVGDDDLEIFDDDESSILGVNYQDWIDSYDAEHEPQYTWTNDNDGIFDEAWEQQFKEEVTWKDIQRVAKTNPTLKSLLDQAVVIYNLSKDNYDKE